MYQYFPIGVYTAKPPCKTCTEKTGRKPGCHDSCELYLKYKAERDEMVAQKRKDNLQKMWKRY